MPIYEYQCRNCGSVSEYLVGLDEDAALACKNCGSLEIEKIMSPARLMNLRTDRSPGRTCCGREERCEAPPCSTGNTCRRDIV